LNKDARRSHGVASRAHPEERLVKGIADTSFLFASANEKHHKWAAQLLPFREHEKRHGVPHTCAANFDNLQSVPKSNIGDRITRLTSRRMKEAAAAVSFALGFDDE
jgi:hypothetical protein